MRLPFRLLAVPTLVAWTVAACAQATVFPDAKAAIAATFVNDRFSEWTSTTGDWNGDGIDDIAMILTNAGGLMEGQLQIRLLVLAGAPDGRYTVMSASSSYCSAQKFFNLEAKGASLFVTEVHKAEGDAMITETRQFRFNGRLGDLELIGKESVAETYDGEYHRTSVNYLSGTAVDYERVRGRVQPKARQRFAVSPPARLNGFDCDRQP